MRIEYKPEKVCPAKIEFELKDNKVYNIKFYGGCLGNTKMIAKLLDGLEAEKIIHLCKGNQCGMRGTSCADQLAAAIENTMEKERIAN